jgi:hypothetical protein
MRAHSSETHNLFVHVLFVMDRNVQSSTIGFVCRVDGVDEWN